MRFSSKIEAPKVASPLVIDRTKKRYKVSIYDHIQFDKMEVGHSGKLCDLPKEGNIDGNVRTCIALNLAKRNIKGKFVVARYKGTELRVWRTK